MNLVRRVVRSLFRRTRTDADMAEEMRLHIEAQADANRAAGMPDEEARHAARREFGHMDGIQEACRDLHGGRGWGRTLAEVRFAARALRKDAGFTGTVVSTLAFGLALGAATVAILNAYLLRSLPYPAAERLYRVIYAPAGQPEPAGAAALDWSSLGDMVEVADSSRGARFLLPDTPYPQEISGLRCSPGSLEALGVRVILGRTLREADFHPGAEPVVLIGHALWRQRFGSDPRILDAALPLGQVDSAAPPVVCRIVGVLPPDFRYVREYQREPMDVVVPSRAPGPAYLVRLRENVPATEAERRVNEAWSQSAAPLEAGIRLESIHAGYVRELRPRLLAAASGAGFVLLIVGVNTAVLVALRAQRRQKEMAVRLAVGASRGDLLRLFLAESGLLCGAGLAGALGLTAATLRLLGPAIEAGLGRPVPGGTGALLVDPFVAGLAVAGTLAFALVLGAVPALAPRLRLASLLGGEMRSAGDRPGTLRARNSLVLLEVATSMTLLVGCGLMVRSVVNLLRTDLGFRTEQVVRARIQLPAGNYADPAAFARFYERLDARLRTRPGLDFAFSGFVPFFESPRQPIQMEGADLGGLRVGVIAAGAGYFSVLGVDVREGRVFAADDRLGSEPVAVVSASLARRLVPDGSAIGRTIRTPDQAVSGAPLTVWRRIVGVVDDIRETHADVALQDVYLPFSQVPSRFGNVIAVTTDSPDQWLERLRATAAGIDPGVVVGASPPLAVQAAQTTAAPRFLTMVLSVFALFAVLLVILGIYGVTAYAARQREREIAIRLALGASSRAILAFVMKNTVRILAAGLATGLFGAAALSKLLESQLGEVSRFDGATLAACGIVLAGVGLMAAWLPARRAARLDPIAVLRSE